MSSKSYNSELRWSNLSVFTKESKHNPSKAILRKSEGLARPGQFLAIMGPSGAGKTTLLNCLSGKHQSTIKVASGQVLINGHQIDSVDYRSMIGFVPQDDVLLESMTVRETLDFSASLTMDLTWDQRQKVVTKLIEELGLTACEQSFVGGKVMRGISGGERKRVSIGVEMIFNPTVLFLDEPTTGLDSFNSLNIVELLSKMAKTKGSTIIATIHQPSSKILTKIDRLLLLSYGNTIYIGKTSKAVDYFKEIGFPIKPNYNPADHFLEVLSDPKFTSLEYRQNLSEKGNKCSLADTIIETPKTHIHISFIIALAYLVKRDFRHIIRNPIIMRGQILKLIVLFSLCSMTFGDLGTSIYDMNDRYGALFLLSNNIIMDSVLSTAPVFQSHKAVFYRENFNRKYSSLPFILSFIITRLPSEILISCGLYGGSYYIIGFNPEVSQFFKMLLVAFLGSFAAGSYGLLVSVISPTMEAASALAPLFIVPFMMCGGYIVSFDKIPEWFILQYISPFRYVFETTIRIDIHDNPDINRQVAEVAIENLKLPEGYSESIYILLGIGISIKLLSILILHILSKKQ